MITSFFSLFSPASYTLFLLANKIQIYRNGKPALDLPLESFALAHTLRQARVQLHVRDEDYWSVGLPLECFSLVRFQLPAVAAENLDEAVRYALIRHVPFDLDQAFMTYTAIRDGNILNISAAVTPWSHVDPLLAGVRDAGIQPASIFPSLVCWAMQTAKDGLYLHVDSNVAEALVLEDNRIVLHVSERLGPETGRTEFLHALRPLVNNLSKTPTSCFTWECAADVGPVSAILDINSDAVVPIPEVNFHCGDAFRINMYSSEGCRKRRLWKQTQLAGLGFLLIALLAFPLAGLLGKKIHLQQLDEEILRIRLQAEHIAEQRGDFLDMVDFLEMLPAKAEMHPQVPELLLEVTQVLPAHGWIDSFQIARNRLRIQGQSSSATSVLEALENSPLLHDVRLEAPVTKSNHRDVFQLSAEIQ